MLANTPLSSRLTVFATGGSLVGLCVLLGAALASGSNRGFLLAGLVVGAMVALFVTELGFESIRLWAVAGVVLYPFLRLPADHPYVTFDRGWIAAIAIALIVRRDTNRAEASARTRLFILAFIWLTLAFVLRAAYTPSGRTGNIETAVDAVVLPLVLFEFVRRTARSVRLCQRLALG